MLARLIFADWCIKHFVKANLLLFYTGFGDSHVYENPALLSFGVLFFRYHNTLVQKITRQNTNTTSAVDVFYKARQWLIASIQVGNKLQHPPPPKKMIWKIIKCQRSYLNVNLAYFILIWQGFLLSLRNNFEKEIDLYLLYLEYHYVRMASQTSECASSAIWGLPWQPGTRDHLSVWCSSNSIHTNAYSYGNSNSVRTSQLLSFNRLSTYVTFNHHV